MSESRSRNPFGEHFSETALLVMGLGFAAMVSQGLFFLLLLGLDLALIVSIRWKGETWVLFRFGWLLMLLMCAFSAGMIALVYALLLGQFS